MSNALSTADQLELPIIETIDGQSIEFKRLTMDDLAKWANEIHNKRKVDAKKENAANRELTPFDRAALFQRIVDADVQLSEVVNKTYTPDGIKKALILSLKKSGMDDAKALDVLKSIHYRRQFELAQEVISPPAEPSPEEVKAGEGSENPTEPATAEIGA